MGMCPQYGRTSRGLELTGQLNPDKPACNLLLCRRQSFLIDAKADGGSLHARFLKMQQLFEDVFFVEGEIGDRPLQLVNLKGRDASILLDTGCAGDPHARSRAQ
jgi:hypothetical protein